MRRRECTAEFRAPPFFNPIGMLFSIMNIVSLAFIGYNMILIYTALRSIPTELYEAARVDRASEVRIAWSIKIPARFVPRCCSRSSSR